MYYVGGNVALTMTTNTVSPSVVAQGSTVTISTKVLKHILIYISFTFI